MTRITWSAALLLPLAIGCATRSEPSGEGTSTSGVLSSMPAEVGTRTRVDFGGTLELLGWDLSATTAEPGATLHLSSYFRVTRPLAPGYSVVTELVPLGPLAKPPAEDDDEKPEADAAPDEKQAPEVTALAKPWPDGTPTFAIVVDERDIEVPKDVTAPSLSLALSIAHDPVQVEGAEIEGLSALRLPILSGLSDGDGRALVARLATGVVPGQARAQKGQRRKLDRRRRPPGNRAPRPALSALRRAFPLHPPVVPKENP